MAYNGATWDESNPTNSTLANEIDDVARDIKIGTRSRMAQEHVWPLSQTGTSEAGYHSFITLGTQTGTPSLIYGASTQMGAIYATAGVGMVVSNSAGAVVTLIGTANLGGGFVPTGGIIMWSGTIANIPSGWFLCNGSNGTPDLRNLFVVGADADAGGVAKSTVSGSALQSGGEATHVLTIPEMPAHTHTVKSTGGAGTGYATAGFNTLGDVTGSTGGGGAHNNLPPYYALAYIMKS